MQAFAGGNWHVRNIPTIAADELRWANKIWCVGQGSTMTSTAVLLRF